VRDEDRTEGAEGSPGAGVLDRMVGPALWVLAVTGLLVGIWAALGPRSFYDDFPGLGRVWIAVDGPYNEHLVRDVGNANLALGLLAVVAALRRTRGLLVATGVAWLAVSVPHLVYHARHTEPFGTGDSVAVLASLALTPLLAAVVLIAGLRRPERSPATGPAPGPVVRDA